MVACASKNRSEGEKVRVSDDIILSSVSSERYLHLATVQKILTEDTGELDEDGELLLDESGKPMTREFELESYLAHASFQRSLWTIGPIQASDIITVIISK